MCGRYRQARSPAELDEIFETSATPSRTGGAASFRPTALRVERWGRSAMLPLQAAAAADPAVSAALLMLRQRHWCGET
jgi:hypothetical protein